VTPKGVKNFKQPYSNMAKTQTLAHHNNIDHKCKYIKYGYGHPNVKYNSGCSCHAIDGTIYNSITIINIIEICFKQLAFVREI
jgi:hypothetical protein